MASILKLLRKIGGAKAPPSSGTAGELAIYKAGATPTDAMSLYAHDGTQWLEVLDTRGKTMSVPVFTDATTAPASPRFGDFWLNTGTNLLSIWDGATWLSTDPHPVATGTAAPTAPTSGALWLDPVKKELQVWDGTRWAHVAFTNVQNTFIQPQLIDVTSTSAALHIKQLGAGHALYVEDEANPDATPFVVDATGNVGVGTVPGASTKLQVNGIIGVGPNSTSTNMSISDNFGANTGLLTLCAGANGLSVVNSGNTTELAGVRADGKLCMGHHLTNGRISVRECGFNPNASINNPALTTYGSFGGGISLMDNTDPSQGVGYSIWLEGGGNNLAIGHGSHSAAMSGGVAILNGATSWSGRSDERDKENIEPITDAARKVKALRAVTGTYVWDEEHRHPFLIAQDVQKVLPEAVGIVNPSASEADQRLALSYTDMVPLLVAALKEALDRIEVLEARP